MPCLSSRVVDGQIIVGVTVIPHVRGGDTTAKTKTGIGGRVDFENRKPYFALMDTGATTTCISSRVITELELKPKGKVEMVSASDKMLRDSFLFSIGISIPGTDNQPFFVTEIYGAEFEGDERNKFDVIIGMDVIMRGSLKLDFDGHFSFCV